MAKVQPEEPIFPDFSEDYKNCSWCSRIIHGWANRFIVYAKANKRVDDRVKMISMLDSDDALTLTEDIEQRLKSKIQQNPRYKASRGIVCILAITFKRDLLTSVCLSACSDFASVINLYSTSFFIAWLRDEDAAAWPGYLFALLLGALYIFSAYTRNYFLMITSRLGVCVRKSLGGLLYKKILRFNQKSKAKATSGKI